MTRRANAIEQLMFFQGSSAPVQFGFQMEWRGTWDEPSLRLALEDECRRNPVLSSRVEPGPPLALVYEGPKVELQETSVEGAPEIALLETLNRPFDLRSGPLFRLVFRRTAQSIQLFWAFHHAIADGRSAISFVQRVLERTMGTNVAETVSSALVEPSSLLDPTHGELVPHPLFVSVPLKGPSLQKAYSVPSFYLKHFRLSKEDTQRLINEVKDLGLSVHAWLVASLVRLTQGLDEKSCQVQRIVQCAVDLREMLPKKDRDVIAVVMTNGRFQVDATQGVQEMGHDLMRQIKRVRNNPANAQDYMNFCRSLDDIPEPEPLLFELIGDSIPYDFSISNMGRFDPLLGGQGAEVGEFYGPIFTATNGEMVLGVNTSGGSFHVSAIYDKAAPRSTFYSGVVTAIGDIFDSLASSKAD